MKYSFGSNICYTLSKAMKYNKKLVPRMLVYTISAVMLPVLTVYFPKLIDGNWFRGHHGYCGDYGHIFDGRHCTVVCLQLSPKPDLRRFP